MASQITLTKFNFFGKNQNVFDVINPPEKSNKQACWKHNEFDNILSIDPGIHNFGVTLLDAHFNPLYAEVWDLCPGKSANDFQCVERHFFISRLLTRLEECASESSIFKMIRFSGINLLVIMEENPDMILTQYIPPLVVAILGQIRFSSINLVTVLPRVVTRYAYTQGLQRRSNRTQKKKWTMDRYSLSNPDIADTILNAEYVNQRFFFV